MREMMTKMVVYRRNMMRMREMTTTTRTRRRRSHLPWTCPRISTLMGNRKGRRRERRQRKAGVRNSSPANVSFLYPV